VDVAVAVLFSQLQFYTGEGVQPPPQTPTPVYLHYMKLITVVLVVCLCIEAV